MTTSTPQLPFKTPQIPSNRDHKALNRATLGGLGTAAGRVGVPQAQNETSRRQCESFPEMRHACLEVAPNMVCGRYNPFKGRLR